MRPRLAIGLLLAALLASLAFNVLLWRDADYFYRDAQSLRLAPNEDDRVPAPQREARTDARPLWVFFGDSRAAAWPAPNIPGLAFRNLGIGGQTSVQVAGRMHPQLLPLRPERVLLQVGINDLKGIALFPERRDEIVANTQRHIDEIVAGARGIGAEVIVSTVFPRARLGPTRRLYWSKQVDEAVLAVNRHIATMASPGVTVFDAAAVLRDAHGIVRPEYALDELHLQDRGYEALNAALLRQLGREAAR